MSSSTETRASKRASPLSVQPVILALVLAGLTAMFAVAVQPDFRGGRFLTSMLALAIVLVGVVLVRAVMGADLARDESEDDVPLKLGERDEIGWILLLRAVAVMAGLFLAIMLLGVVIGLTLATFAILRLHMQVPLRLAALLALIWGIVVPVVFGTTLDVAMWPGLVPELIPRWIGGGILPPL